MNGIEKITFAGGEPLLYKDIKEVIKYTKTLGITTSIITNGSLLTYDWLKEMEPYLDWLGVSIDALDKHTNSLIGRKNSSGKAMSYSDYYFLIQDINSLKYKLKINTVVNTFNKHVNFNPFIEWAKPDRWKVFQTLRVEGQNDKHFDEIKCSKEEFDIFINAHKHQKSIVVEDNNAMTGSYLLCDPQGRFFENSQGKHSYSNSLIDSDFMDCYNELSFDKDKFVERGGIYNW